MKKKAFIWGTLVVAMVLGFILSLGYKAAAVDAPHTLENTLAPSVKGCTQTCHAVHNAAGGPLYQVAGNVNLCVSCHKSVAPSNAYDLPANNPTVPDSTGIHHQYNVLYTNLNGSSPATMFPGKLVLEGNNIICSSCHDVHNVYASGTDTSKKFGSQKISVQPGVASTATNASPPAGSGTLTLNAPPSDASAKAYLIDVVVAGDVGVGGAKFRLSNDGGISWWGYSGGWVAWTGSNGQTTGTNVALNDSTSNVTVTFGGSGLKVGDRWQFYVSYSFLRGALDSGPNDKNVPPGAGTVNFCRHCHVNRVNTYTEVRGPGGGGKIFNHPVGAALNDNGKAYDSNDGLVYKPRDANGAYQGSGGADTNPANNLRLASDNTVQCYTCHSVHYGYSNSLVNSDIPYNW